MSEPLSILAGVLSVLVSVKSVAEQVIKFVDDWKGSDETLYDAQRSIESIGIDFETWVGTWTDKNNLSFSRETYEYFWDASGCDEVEVHMEKIFKNFKALITALYEYFPGKSMWRKFKYVHHKESSLRNRMKKLRHSIKDIVKLTRSSFWKNTTGKVRTDDVGERPLKLARLMEQSERIWSTLKSHGNIGSGFEHLIMEPRIGNVKRYQDSLWKSLSGECTYSHTHYLYISFVRDRRRHRLRYRVNVDKGLKDSIEQDTERLFTTGLSLRACLGLISERPRPKQKELRCFTTLDRLNTAIDIAEWALLTWSTQWTANLCVCNVHYVHNTDARGQRLVTCALTIKEETECFCFSSDVAARKYLSLGAILAALALGSQIAVILEQVPKRTAQVAAARPRYIVHIGGSLQVMDRTKLITRIEEAHNDDNRWAIAIDHCLELDKSMMNKPEFHPADFQLYHDHVLEPLEDYRRNLEELRGDDPESQFRLRLPDSVVDHSVLTNGIHKRYDFGKHLA